ncbi:MAG: tRNA (adenosine(37)-N6)-threonylcarbamoyltransferase complex dimerization subunit type 1 TsaB [Candidatus Oleimmundimicrobium sp.]|nr:tRNA (adenosine(37)-N6)-threonylcarbamoyltransferase complex dimerization subunit type 1 TsaB [Candidatus Oleimmundimicrobium sp.]
MLLLAFDTSSDFCTVAIGKKDVLLGERSIYAPQGHMQKLLPLVDSLLSDVGCDIRDIDVVAVGLGPGSFTGVRIGVSIAKGLAQGLKKPIIGISSLDALAKNLSLDSGLVCAVVDAKRKEVYSCLYKCSNEGIQRLTNYEALSSEKLSDKLNNINQDGEIILVGDGLKLYGSLFKKRIRKVNFASSEMWCPKASSIKDLAFIRLESGAYDNYLTLVPIYARIPIAEEMWKKTQAQE